MSGQINRITELEIGATRYESLVKSLTEELRIVSVIFRGGEVGEAEGVLRVADANVERTR
jgi:hypothetical protein